MLKIDANTGVAARQGSRRSSLKTIRRIVLSGCAGLLLTPFAAARADVRQVGAVNIASDRYTTVNWQHFEGQVAKLAFVAENDTIRCDHIDVTYHDGTTHMVFAGTIPKDSTETITFPEGDSRIMNVNFTCKADSVDGARINLSALSEGDSDLTREAPLRRDAHVVAQPGPALPPGAP